jgi:hypothetical protein
VTDPSPQRLASKLDRAVATIIVAERAEDQFFIAESMVAGAATFLLLEYCKGFFKGLGLNKLAEDNGKLAATVLAELRDGKPVAAHPERLDQLEAALDQVRANRGSAAAKAAGESEVAETLRKLGAIPRQAADTAADVGRAIEPDE